MTDQQTINRGLEAKRILENHLWQEAQSHIDAELWRLFKETSPKDTEVLQYIRQMQYIHGKYVAFLAKAVTDGKMAELKVEQQKKSLRDRIFG